MKIHELLEVSCRGQHLIRRGCTGSVRIASTLTVSDLQLVGASGKCWRKASKKQNVFCGRKFFIDTTWGYTEEYSGSSSSAAAVNSINSGSGTRLSKRNPATTQFHAFGERGTPIDDGICTRSGVPTETRFGFFSGGCEEKSAIFIHGEEGLEENSRLPSRSISNN
jgi:hypothetical protein